MLYRFAAALLILTACPDEPATQPLQPAQLTGGSSSSGGHSGAVSGAGGISPSIRPAVCPAATECPAASACPACPAPTECPASSTCPAPQPTACPDPYPTIPTTYGAADAWPLPTDHPHGLTAFCHVSLPTVDSADANVTADIGCGDVNDARWNHVNLRYTQTRTKIDDATGEISQVTTDRGCYGPHGADYADTCTPGAQCFVDFWIPVQGHVYRTAWGTCSAP